MKSDNYFLKKDFQSVFEIFLEKIFVKFLQNVDFFLRIGNGNGALPYPFSFFYNILQPKRFRFFRVQIFCRILILLYLCGIDNSQNT